MEQKTLMIKFDADAFKRQEERQGLLGHRRYTRHVAEMNRVAEALDCYDEFGALTLSATAYAQAGGVYGIPKKSFHEGNKRLRTHQVDATEAFLRDLRGFGLLADVVGSGKTYEACAVLSELAAKGKISSLLLIVPGQVYSTWREVLEVYFGLGKDVLYTADGHLNRDLLELGEDGMYRPTRPIIVTSENFVKWHEGYLQNVLFDAVVVDEAHNMCGEEGDSARSMKLLSILMQTKKRAKKTYCVLLSATPHSGNLAQMFRLWYFIRCKGGSPDDFDVKDDARRSEVYRSEKAHYFTHICRGAVTVMEFIENVRMSEVTVTFALPFGTFLEEKAVEDFDTLLIAEKKALVTEFLNGNPDIRDKVNNNIAVAYHRGVLRSIMIRQPNDGNRLLVSKRIENLFFFPAKGGETRLSIKGLNGKPITVDLDHLDDDKAITDSDGDTCSVAEYVDTYKKNESSRAALARLFFDARIFKALGVDDGVLGKPGAISYYKETMALGNQSHGSSEDNVGTHFVPVFGGDVFEAKIVRMKELLRRYADARVLLFFDYDIEKSERCYDKVLAALLADEEFACRVVEASSNDTAATEQKFREKKNTILVVTGNSFTEGANLQESNVIINFQVTPNPLAMEQRIGRIFRMGQDHDVTIYSFADMRRLEGYALMYLTTIGLMTSNSGDAAIIAGSNSENMVTIRCNACSKVKLLSREEYEEKRKKDDPSIYGISDLKCTAESKKGTLMTEINTSELKCTTCGAVVRREADDQYYCLSNPDDGSHVMCNEEGNAGNRNYYCRKICAIAHCERFTSGVMAGRCPALAKYREDPSVSDIDLAQICSECEQIDYCNERCRLRVGEESTMECHRCGESHACRPRPHVLVFDDKWNAECPACKASGTSGTLRPVVARTFETYIRGAYEYQRDGGQAFCANLLTEARRVSIIQQILSNDNVGGRRGG